MENYSSLFPIDHPQKATTLGFYKSGTHEADAADRFQHQGHLIADLTPCKFPKIQRVFWLVSSKDC